MSYVDYYDGSALLLPLANKIGLPIDLVNFLTAQIAALGLARLFRKPFKYASPEFRHSMCLIIGLIMGYFCFGKQAIHMSVLPMLSYTLLKTVPHHHMGNAVLAASMTYLSCLHLHRQIYHTADYALDITGPLMVITQRVTSVAYSLQDSYLKKKSSNLNLKERDYSDSPLAGVEEIPSPLEYFGYTLAFQTLMCGPVVFYSDYIDFIHGVKQGQKDLKESSPEPSPRSAVAVKVAGSLAAAVIYLMLSKVYKISVFYDLVDPSSEVSRTWSTMYLLWYAYLSTLIVRCKYYHAWLLSDAICNNSGMGFNGYDDAGKPKWDKMSNIDVFGFELAQNFRTAVASWNKNTNTWLRYVAYVRGGGMRTARVYALSALWHGFYPGYYLTFLTGALFTTAARKVRAIARPVFLGNEYKKLAYDAATFLTTRVCMTYATIPFVMLHLAPGLAFYGRFYYSLHILAVGAIFLPGRRSPSGTPSAGSLDRKPPSAPAPALPPAANGNGNGAIHHEKEKNT